MRLMDVSDGVPLRIQMDAEHGVVTLHGDLDSESAPLLIREVEGWLAEGGTELRLDVAELRFVDSAGLRSLLILRERATRVDATVVVVRPSDATRRLLEIIGLDDVLLAPDSEDAGSHAVGDDSNRPGNTALGER